MFYNQKFPRLSNPKRAPPENLVFSLHDKSNPRIESCQMRTLRKRKALIPLMMIKKPQLENSIDCLFSYLLQFLRLKTRSIGRIMVIIIIIMEFPFTNFNNVSTGVFSFLTSVNLKKKISYFSRNFSSIWLLIKQNLQKTTILFHIYQGNLLFCIYQIKII